MRTYHFASLVVVTGFGVDRTYCCLAVDVELVVVVAVEGDAAEIGHVVVAVAVCEAATAVVVAFHFVFLSVVVLIYSRI